MLINPLQLSFRQHRQQIPADAQRLLNAPVLVPALCNKPLLKLILRTPDISCLYLSTPPHPRPQPGHACPCLLHNPHKADSIRLRGLLSSFQVISPHPSVSTAKAKRPPADIYPFCGGHEKGQTVPR